MRSRPAVERYWNVPATTMAIDTHECCSSNGRSSGPDVQMTSSTFHPSPDASTRPVTRPRSPVTALRASARSTGEDTAIFPKTSSPVRSMIVTNTSLTEKVLTGGTHDDDHDHQDADPRAHSRRGVWAPGGSLARARSQGRPRRRVARAGVLASRAGPPQHRGTRAPSRVLHSFRPRGPVRED